MEHRINGFCIYIQPDGFGTETKRKKNLTKRQREEEKNKKKQIKPFENFIFHLSRYTDVYRCYVCVLFIVVVDVYKRKLAKRPTWRTCVLVCVNAIVVPFTII